MKWDARRLGWIGVIGGLVLAGLAARAEDRPAKPYAVPKDRAEWEARRVAIRQAVWGSMGGSPPYSPEMVGPMHLSQSLPEGADSAHRVPAVIWICDEPDDALRPGPDGGSIARSLHDLGYAVFVFDAIDGKVPPWADDPPEPGRPSSWGLTLFRDRMLLDGVLKRPEIDPKRVGVAGAGLGGTRALWLMAMDDRVACGEVVGGIARLSDWRAAQGPGERPLAPWAISMLKQFDAEALLALCAPRPLEILVGDRDPLSPGSSYKVFHDTAGRAYKLYDKGGNFHATLFGRQGPGLTPLAWDMALETFDKSLKPQGPTPLGHDPAPEPAVDGRFTDPAAGGIAGWVSEMSQRPGAWTWRDGTIVCAPGANEYGWLRCPVELDDFVLSLEWKVPAKGNSGVFLRARPVDWTIPPSPDSKPLVATLGPTWPSRTGLELQAQDDPGIANKYSSGSLYRHAAPAENPTRKAGEWNTYTVRCRGPRVEVWSNGTQVLDTRLDQHPTLRRPPLRGYFGLQNHGVGAEFRNIRYVKLEPESSASEGRP